MKYLLIMLLGFATEGFLSTLNLCYAIESGFLINWLAAIVCGIATIVFATYIWIHWIRYSKFVALIRYWARKTK